MGYVRTATVLAVLGFLILGGAPVFAGGFADLYLGGSFHQEEDVSFSAAGQRVSGESDPDNAFTIGYRMGYWFEGARWLGVALDGSYYTHDMAFADVTIFPLSALLMVQAVSNDKHRREPVWVPYAGVGPALFFADIEYDVSNSGVPALLALGGLSGKYEDEIAEVGLDARAGVRYMFRENIGVFGEYRFTTFSPEFEENVLGVKVKTEFDANTHHVVFGLNYSF